MSNDAPKDLTPAQQMVSRSDELMTFLFLTIVLAPILAVFGIGGYGLIVWMTQLIFGPPGA